MSFVIKSALKFYHHDLSRMSNQNHVTGRVALPY